MVSDDCLLHETACNTKCIGKLVLIVNIDILIFTLVCPFPFIKIKFTNDDHINFNSNIERPS